MKNKKIMFMMGLIILTGFYLFLRLGNFEEKANYFSDQGLHLLESYQMVEDRKIRLIGPMVTSKTFLDRGFFIGPQYYYVLAILGQLTKWNPISIDLILLFIELGFILYFANWIRKKCGVTEALTVFGLMTFSRFFITHSRFFWNPHFLLPLGVLAIVFLDKYIQKNKIRYLVGFGFLWGIAFSFHYSAVFWGIPLLIVLLKNKKIWKWSTLIIPLFFVIGDLPWFIFEIRHNFYNIKTVLWVMSQSTVSGVMETYYFIHPLIIFGLFGLAWMLKKIKKNKFLIGLVLVLGISFFQKNPIPSTQPKGWNYPIEKGVVSKILENGCPKNFNVAETINGYSRAYDLRFLLTVKGCKPMGVEDYSKTKTLFLIAPSNRPPETEKSWEVNSLGKFKINQQENLSKEFIFYELEGI